MTGAARRLAGYGLAAALVAGSALAEPARAADYDDAAIPPPRLLVDVSPSFRSWDVEDSTSSSQVSQVHVPITLTAPLGDRIDLVAGTAIVQTRLEDPDGAEGTLSGLTDVGVKAFWKPARAGFLAIGVNLPTGDGTLDSEAGEGELSEASIAQAMWSPILGFRSKRMGEGFGFELGGGWAVPLSQRATLGFGAGFVGKGEYDLYQSGDATTPFTPGGEGSVSAGLDFRPDERTLLRFDVAGRFFGEDEQEGEPIYQSGNQFEFDAYAARRQPSWWGSVRGRVVSKSDDEMISGTADSSRIPVRSAGLSAVFGELAFQLSPAFALGAEASFASFGESNAPVSDGTTASVGPALHWTRRGGPSGATLRALYLTGSAADGDIDLSGTDLSASLTLGF